VIGVIHGREPLQLPIMDCNYGTDTRGLSGKLHLVWGAFKQFLDPDDESIVETSTIVNQPGAIIKSQITGPDRICTTNTNFTLQNVPAGQTVSWAVSPTHLFPTSGRSGTGTTAALRAMHSTSSGLATLTFTVYTPSDTYQISTPIWVGVPGAITSTLPNYHPICTGEYTYFNAYYNMFNPNQPGNGESDIINYVWAPPSGGNCWTAGNKNEVLICLFPQGAGFGINHTVAVRAVNTCGQGAFSYSNFNVSDCFYYSVGINPNPDSDRVAIELTETPLDDGAKSVLQSENKASREYHEYSFNSPPTASEYLTLSEPNDFAWRRCPRAIAMN